MAIGTTAATIIGAAGSVLGGIAGGQGSSGTQTTTTTKNVAPAGARELELENRTSQMMNLLNQDAESFRARAGQSLSTSDVLAGRQASLSLADMLQQYSQSSGLPSQQDISTSQDLAKNLFAARQVSLQQSFQDQLTDANRRAALMGRSLNDPILASKLAQEQTRQSQLLQAEQGSLAQQIAMGLPGQRLGYAQQRADVLQNLGSQDIQRNQLELANQVQAMQNRQALLAMGSSLLGQEKQFRLGSAGETQVTSKQGGGGLGGIISGALGGAGMALKGIGGLTSLFGGGGSSGGGGLGGIFGGGDSGGASNVGSLSGYNYGQSGSDFFGLGK